MRQSTRSSDPYSASSSASIRSLGDQESPQSIEMGDLKQSSDYVEHVEEQIGRVANYEDHQATIREAFRENKRAVFWCAYVIWLLILASFENQAGGSILGIPEFRKDFGYAYDGSYVLPAKWQSAFSGGPVASSVIGSLSIGWLSDRIGRRLGYACCFIFSIVGITLEVVATSNPVFFSGKLINGFGIGGIIAISFTYVGEVVPTALRGIMSSAAAIAFTFGPLIVTFIVKGTGTYTTRWAYRAVFVSQYGVLAIGLVGWLFLPESPFWLISRNKEAKAKQSLRKFGYSEHSIEKRIAAIVLTLEECRRETAGASYMECIKRSNLRRTIISIAPLSIQALSGVFFMSAYATYYFQLAGFSTDLSFDLSIVQQIASMLGNVCSWLLIDRIGRRSLTFWGLALITCILWIMGGLAVANTPDSLKGVSALIIIYCFFYNVTIGATAYAILTEVSTGRLRVKTIAIGSALQNAIFTMWSFVFPYLFNPDQANLGAKTSFIFGGLAILCLLYLWIYQPETAGRTYEELDEMFIKRVPARKFKGYKTEAELKGMQAAELLNDTSPSRET